MFVMVAPSGLACEKFQENSEFRTPFNQDACQVLVLLLPSALLVWDNRSSLVSYLVKVPLCFFVCFFYPLKGLSNPFPKRTLHDWRRPELIGLLLHSLIKLLFPLTLPPRQVFCPLPFFRVVGLGNLFANLLASANPFSNLFKLPPPPTVSHSFFSDYFL